MSFEIKGKTLFCTLTEDDIENDFKKLQNMKMEPCYSKQQWELKDGKMKYKNLGLLGFCNYGKQFSNYFHWKDRFAARSIHHRSAWDVFEDYKSGKSEMLKNATKSLRKHYPRISESRLLFESLAHNSAIVTVKQFRPFVSKFFCDKMGSKNVLDFSAGWGDRLAGFLASKSVKNITLIEPRKNAKLKYIEQYKFAKKYNGLEQNLVIHTGAAEDIMPTLNNKFDLIISSPPYLDLEIYDNTQSPKNQAPYRYKNDVEKYLKKFLYPVIDNSFRMLNDTGIFCLNIGDNSKKGVIYTDLIIKYVQSKFSDIVLVGVIGYRKMSTMWYGKKVIAEPIFCFCKKSNKQKICNSLKGQKILTRRKKSRTILSKKNKSV
tara:strand:- start:96 stop:1220 length:1125 start_codon:yes stop_codon:yes gene_type:complete